MTKIKYEKVVWVTKALKSSGDLNTRRGVAEQISEKYLEFDIPLDFCTPKEIKEKLIASKLLVNGDEWPDVLIGPCFHIPYMQEIIDCPENPIIINNDENNFETLNPYLNELESHLMLLDGERDLVIEILSGADSQDA